MSDKDLVVALMERSILHGICSDVMNDIGDENAARKQHSILMAYQNIAFCVCLFESLSPKDFGL